MNNSDFLSDAVALDLGKSGVKVAETLEIEVGEEWWRLINAADVMEGEVYRRRKPVDPIVEGDTIHLQGVLQNQGLIYSYFYQSTSSFSFQKSSAVGVVDSGKVYYASVGQCRTDAYGSPFKLGMWPIIEVKESDGSIVGTYTHSDLNPEFPLHLYFLIWDGVNNRFLVVGRRSGVSYVSGMNVDGTVVTPQQVSNSTSLSLQDVKVFLEKPNYVYSLFYTGGFFYIKETEITSNVAPLTLSQTVTTFSAETCTKLDNVSNSGGKGWLFYSRAFDSVGFMWRDSDVGAIKFTLQSESFLYVHTFPDISFGGARWIEDLGNFAIPNEGEFLVVKTAYLPTGVLTRPSGWSYPANFKIIGSSELSATSGVIIGKVDTTVYRIEVNFESMAISKVWSIELPLEIDWIVRLVHQENGREIYTVTDSSNTDYKHGITYMIFCVDTVLESLVWSFYSSLATIGTTAVSGDWFASSLWPTAYNRRIYHMRFRVIEDKAIFTRHPSDNAGRHLESYTVNLSGLVACNSKSEVYLLLQSSGLNIVSSIPFRIEYSIFSAAAHVVKKDELFIDAALVRTNALNLWFPKPAVKLTSISNFSTSLYLYGNRRGGSDVPYGYTSPNKTYTNLTDEVDGDSALVWYKCASPSNGPSIYTWAFIVFDDSKILTGASVDPRSIFASAQDYKIYPIALNDKNARLVFQGNNTNFATHGCAFNTAVSSCAAYSDALTLPFNYLFGLVNQSSNRFFALSNVVDGDIQWARFNAKEGLERKFYAVRPDDMSQVYAIDGLETSGGWVDIKLQGRFITGVTGVGRTVAVDLEAKDTEGYLDETPEGEGVIGSYIYEYSTRQFTPYPFAREGIRAELSNISKTTKITLPETRTNLIRGLLASGTDFRGSRCILRRIFPDHADTTGSDIVLLDGYIQDWSYVPGKKGIAFTVSKTLIDVGAQFPKRLMNMGCSHVFKGARCKYLGETGRCLKTKAFCQFLNNQNQFGGFPWVAARQRRVMWR